MSNISQQDSSITIRSKVTKTLTGNNTTTAVPIFRITGSVDIIKLRGFVTTALGSNHTAAYWRLNDQTTQTDITAASGTTLSSFGVGSILIKVDLNSQALGAANSTSALFGESTVRQQAFFQEFVVIAKNGANTDIEYVYTTTNTPTSGAIEFIIDWLPVSSNGAVTIL